MWDRIFRHQAYIGITRSCMRWYVRKKFLTCADSLSYMGKGGRKDFLSQGKILECKKMYFVGLPEASSTMRALGVLSSAFSLNSSARQDACKRSRFKSIGVSPENPRRLPEQ